MGGVEFKIDSVNNKGQYSIDGGANWQNFSSVPDSDIDVIAEISASESGTIQTTGFARIFASRNSASYGTYTLTITHNGETRTFSQSSGTIDEIDDVYSYWTDKLIRVHAGDTYQFTRSSGVSYTSMGFYIYPM